MAIKIAWCMCYWKSIAKYPWVWQLRPIVRPRDEITRGISLQTRNLENNFLIDLSVQVTIYRKCSYTFSTLRRWSVLYPFFFLFVFFLIGYISILDHRLFSKRRYSNWWSFARNEKLVHGRSTIKQQAVTFITFMFCKKKLLVFCAANCTFACK